MANDTVTRRPAMMILVAITAQLGTVFAGVPQALSQEVAQAQGDPGAPPAVAALARERAERLAEQRQPRTAVAFDPAGFDQYAGTYQIDRYDFFALTREGEHFFGAPIGGTDERKMEIFPESPAKFFVKSLPAQIGFVAGPHGKGFELLLHTNGFEVPARKVSEAVVAAALAERAQRIKDNAASPGTETALRRYIAAFQNGRPNYGEMIPVAALLTFERFPKYAGYFQKWGALTSLTFTEVMPNGFNRYLAVYEHGRVEMRVEPLSDDGKIAGITIGKVEDR